MSGIAMKIMSAAGGDIGAWDLSYAYYDPPESLAWDISTAAFLQQRGVRTEDALPTGLSFKPDGTKMYVLGGIGDAVYEYDLSTAWDISTSSFTRSRSVAAQEQTVNDLFFKPDGTKMYVIGQTNDNVNEYNLSTAWNIGTASFSQSFSVFSQEATPTGLSFKPDGTKMYVVGGSGDDVNEYDLSTAWDVSSASFLQNFSDVAQTPNPRGLAFKPDGTKMYAVSGSSINEYDLSTAWDISSASFLQGQATGSISAIFFKPDGLGVYTLSGLSDAVNQYSLGGFDISGQETNPTGLFFKPDGTKMYVVGDTGNDVNEYDLSTAWDVYSASFLQNFSVNAQEANPHGLFFKPDGTKMYVVGVSGDAAYEYDLSTAWDVSSASFLQSFSVAAQETQPQGLFFKSDGTKMYVIGQTGDDVNEYDLSTAWDISSASFLQNFSVGAQETQPEGLFFKPDGLKMYVVGQAGDDVNEYDLSTAWDVSSASFLQNFSVGAQAINPSGIFFKPDGTQMLMVGLTTRCVFPYTLAPQD